MTESGTEERIETAVIIPARGGSIGIPGKNVKWISGLPLIGHTIVQAQAAQFVERIYVSTDDPQIAEISRHHNANVIDRPDDISGKLASSEAALLHALDYLQRTENYEPELIIFLQCTSPLTLACDIDGAVHTLLGNNADSALSVAPFHQFLWKEDKNGSAVGINHEINVRSLRQNLEPQYVETGSVYVMRTAGFRKHKHRFFGRTVMHIIPRERCHEVDDPVDMAIAEVLMREQRSVRNGSLLPENIDAVVFDFDGVMTDNRVIVFQNREEAVVCNRGDGLGLARLREHDIELLVLSTEKNEIVRARCSKLGIECIHGVDDKLPVLLDWLRSKNILPANTVYVGNDVNDLTCLKTVGCGVAVADAYTDAMSAARIILSSPGGDGAVRELTDLVIAHNNKNRVPTP